MTKWLKKMSSLPGVGCNFLELLPSSRNEREAGPKACVFVSHVLQQICKKIEERESVLPSHPRTDKVC
jgi:hypothetical protein